MFTWRMWNALERPFTQHPMFGRYIHKIKRTKPIYIGNAILLPNVVGSVSRMPWGMIAFVIVLAFICSGQWFLLFPMALFSPLVLLSVGILYGSNNATLISSTLTKARMQGQYDLLGVTPLGHVGYGWAVVSAVYHSRQSLRQLKDTTRTFYNIAIIVLLVYIGFNLMSMIIFQSGITLFTTLMADTIPTLLFVVSLYIDLIQSTILGCIMGLLIPTYANGHLDANAMAFTAFIALQMLFYAGFALIAFWLLPLIIASDNGIIFALIRFVIFVLFRDILMMILWRIVARRMSTDLTELNHIVEL